VPKAPEHISAPFRVRVDDGAFIDLDPELIRKKGIRLDHLRGNQYVLYNNGKTIPLVIETIERKKVAISTNNRSFSVVVLDHRDQLLAELGLDDVATGSPSELVSPMPGLVVSISVSVGDVVTTGTRLLVLEAMKMENEIKSPADGLIAAIHTQPGDAVQKGQVLIEFGKVAT